MRSGGEEITKGFLISCDKNREKEAVRDAYNFLKEVNQPLSSISRGSIRMWPRRRFAKRSKVMAKNSAYKQKYSIRRSQRIDYWAR
jgi:hypothetical protein